MSRIANPYDQEPPKHGILFLQALIALLFFVFFFRFWYLQIIRGEELATRALNNRLTSEDIYAPRGIIEAAGGELLAINEPYYYLQIISEDVKDLDKTFNYISNILQVPTDVLKKRYEEKSDNMRLFRPVILAEDLTFEQVSIFELQSFRWPGLEIKDRPRRKYFFGKEFAHLLGYIAEVDDEDLKKDTTFTQGDSIGKSGIEEVYNATLRGKKGTLQYERDTLGRQFLRRIVQEAESGQKLRLTIDLGLQKLLHEALIDKEGVVVVQNAKTGAIKALVSAPSFDGNLFTHGYLEEETWKLIRSDPRSPLQHRAIQSSYPPASIFKLVVAGLALEEGIITASDEIVCKGGYKINRRFFRCWRRGGHGNVNLSDALAYSCDVYFYLLGEKLTVDKISAYAKANGFGKKIGIGFPEEVAGLIPTREWKEKKFKQKWQGGEDLNLSIGQGYTLVTPLQVARYISALVNDGKMLHPFLVDGEPTIVDQNLELSKENLLLLKNAMIATVEEKQGTGRILRRKNFVIGAKTGTAQVVSWTDEMRRKKKSDIPYDMRDHGWMVSFIELGDEVYTVTVIYEHGVSGGVGAGKLANLALNYLIEQEKTSKLEQEKKKLIKMKLKKSDNLVLNKGKN